MDASAELAAAESGESTSTTVDPCAPTTTTTAPSEGSGGLPKTGADSRSLALLGLALVVSGGAIVLTVHRGRRRAAS